MSRLLASVIAVLVGCLMAFIWDERTELSDVGSLIEVAETSAPGFAPAKMSPLRSLDSASFIEGYERLIDGDIEGLAVYPTTPQGSFAGVETAAMAADYNAPVRFNYVANLSATSEFAIDLAPVGRLDLLDVDGEVVGHCTAAAISQTHILTAGHCFYDAAGPRIGFDRAVFGLGLLVPEKSLFFDPVFLEVEVPPPGEENSDPERWQVVYEEGGLDFAVLPFRTAEDGETDQWARAEAWAARRGIELEPVKLADAPIEGGDELYIGHHALGWAQVLSAGGADCQHAGRASEHQFLHTCDTLKGSSGAPVFSSNYRSVVGLHVCCDRVGSDGGLVGRNYAVRVAEIAASDRSPVLNALIDLEPLTAEQVQLVLKTERTVETVERILAQHDNTFALELLLNRLNELTAKPDSRFLTDLTPRLLDLLRIAYWTDPKVSKIRPDFCGEARDCEIARAALSGSGRYIYFENAEDLSIEVWNILTAQRLELPQMPGPTRALDWMSSHDVLGIAAAGGSEVIALDVGDAELSGAPARIPMDFEAARVSPDGRRMAVFKNGSYLELLQLDASSNRQMMVPSIARKRIELAPDNHAIFSENLCALGRTQKLPSDEIVNRQAPEASIEIWNGCSGSSEPVFSGTGWSAAISSTGDKVAFLTEESQPCIEPISGAEDRYCPFDDPRNSLMSEVFNELRFNSFDFSADTLFARIRLDPYTQTPSRFFSIGERGFDASDIPVFRKERFEAEDYCSEQYRLATQREVFCRITYDEPANDPFEQIVGLGDGSLFIKFNDTSPARRLAGHDREIAYISPGDAGRRFISIDRSGTTVVWNFGPDHPNRVFSELTTENGVGARSSGRPPAESEAPDLEDLCRVSANCDVDTDELYGAEIGIGAFATNYCPTHGSDCMWDMFVNGRREPVRTIQSGEITDIRFSEELGLLTYVRDQRLVDIFNVETLDASSFETAGRAVIDYEITAYGALFLEGYVDSVVSGSFRGAGGSLVEIYDVDFGALTLNGSDTASKAPRFDAIVLGGEENLILPLLGDHSFLVIRDCYIDVFSSTTGAQLIGADLRNFPFGRTGIVDGCHKLELLYNDQVGNYQALWRGGKNQVREFEFPFYIRSVDSLIEDASAHLSQTK